jgi:hypothetical protein
MIVFDWPGGVCIEIVSFHMVKIFMFTGVDGGNNEHSMLAVINMVCRLK